jgi:23S rRNA U2552 (ribose-2'-O)-methylase RlmE/FtsJ
LRAAVIELVEMLIRKAAGRCVQAGGSAVSKDFQHEKKEHLENIVKKFYFEKINFQNNCFLKKKPVSLCPKNSLNGKL